MGMQNAECRMQNGKCRMQSAECRMRKAETRSNMSKACLASSATMFQELMQNAEWGMQNAK